MEAIGDALLDRKWLIQAEWENYRVSMSYPSYFSDNSCFLIYNYKELIQVRLLEP